MYCLIVTTSVVVVKVFLVEILFDVALVVSLVPVLEVLVKKVLPFVDRDAFVPELVQDLDDRVLVISLFESFLDELLCDLVRGRFILGV